MLNCYELIINIVTYIHIKVNLKNIFLILTYHIGHKNLPHNIIIY